MRLLVQHVKEAQVQVDGAVIGKIGKGLLAFIGVQHHDTLEDCLWLKEKLLNLRIFKDKDDKMNLSLLDVGGELLIVSQFTLYADCNKGRRPTFIHAAPPLIAEQFYERFIEETKKQVKTVQTGQFGAHMEVGLINDGPLTFMLESPNS